LASIEERFNTAKLTASPFDLPGKYATSLCNKNHLYNAPSPPAAITVAICYYSLHLPERDGQAELA